MMDKSMDTSQYSSVMPVQEQFRDADYDKEQVDSIGSDEDHHSFEEEIMDDHDDEAARIKQNFEPENKAVNWLRISLFVVLMVSTILVAVSVYLYLRHDEQAKFEVQFKEEANKILQAVGTQFEMSLGALDFLAVNILSHARGSNQSWPLVTIPDFAVRAEKLLRITNVVFLDVYPLVEQEQRLEWENYTAEKGVPYLNETNNFMERSGIWEESKFFNLTGNLTDMNIMNQIYQAEFYDTNFSFSHFEPVPYTDPGPFTPRWQGHTPLTSEPYNFDYLSDFSNETLVTVMETHEVVVGSTVVENDISWFYPGSTADVTSQVMFPILDSSLEYLRRDSETYDPAQDTFRGALAATIIWSDLVTSILPRGSNGIRVYFEDTCGSNFTYEVNGPGVEFLGSGDNHESQYDYLEVSAPLLALHQYSTRAREFFEYTGPPVNPDFCPFTVRIYPSTKMEARFKTNNPAVFTAVAVLIFAFTSFLFVAYDWYVDRRQRKVMDSAISSNQVVAAFYPKEIRERVYNQFAKKREAGEKGWTNGDAEALHNDLDAYYHQMNNGNTTVSSAHDAPIADFYPETTVMFAHIAGFTSWSSTREPAAVFILLERLYLEFDQIAKRKSVFKVETIGDCYLAVCGLPRPRRQHAVVMARFAAECRDKFNSMMPELELTLGPGTADLMLRVGLHSGACTGGVLRGDKSLFTLFGDTVNTASLMERSGRANFVHVSQATADYLRALNKTGWLTRRDDLITLKGKGRMQTFWVEPSQGTGTVSTLTGTDFSDSVGELDLHGFHIGGSNHGDEFGNPPEGAPSFESYAAKKRTSFNKLNKRRSSRRQIFEEEHVIELFPAAQHAAKVERMIDWNVTMLEEMVKKVIAQRGGRTGFEEGDRVTLEWRQQPGRAAVDEIVDAIPVAPRTTQSRIDMREADMPIEVIQQLHGLVSAIAHGYSTTTHYHNFDHVSHMSMTLHEFIQRIIFSKQLGVQQAHVNSFGMATDPLAQIAVIFSILIRDLHRSEAEFNSKSPDCGVNDTTSSYMCNAIGGQQSLDAGWDIFMSGHFCDLRACLFTCQEDLNRFRQIVVNSVMATDFSDPALIKRRESHWKRAFGEERGSMGFSTAASGTIASGEGNDSSEEENENAPAVADDADDELEDLRATVVLEHIIQAAVVCHGLQPWALFTKWTRKLILERYAKVVTSKLTSHVSRQVWHQRELDFMDDIVIPLAKRLKLHGIMGEYSGTYWSYAKENRSEWIAQGHDLVNEVLVLQDQTSTRHDDDPDALLESSHHATSLQQLLLDPVIEGSEEIMSRHQQSSLAEMDEVSSFASPEQAPSIASRSILSSASAPAGYRRHVPHDAGSVGGKSASGVLDRIPDIPKPMRRSVPSSSDSISVDI